MKQVSIIGAGAWGTALAIVAARAGRNPVLWAYEPEVVDTINNGHVNARFLPGIELPASITATNRLSDALEAEAILLAVPAQLTRGICRQLASEWRQDVPAVICSKGIEIDHSVPLSVTIEEELPKAVVAVLSGPTFASEVARGLPTAVTLACEDSTIGMKLVEAIGGATFRPYLTNDVIGAELGGAVKNVLAIACGTIEGRGMGDNARAALITRGLTEMMRLAVAMGGRSETCMGLAGMGDLVLTAASRQSRNYSLGLALGSGLTLEQAQAKSRGIVEGVPTAKAVVRLAQDVGIEMPICAAVDQVLHHGADLDETIRALLARPFRAEIGFSLS